MSEHLFLLREGSFLYQVSIVTFLPQLTLCVTGVLVLTVVITLTAEQAGVYV
jgi:hypothetical protein